MDSLEEGDFVSNVGRGRSRKKRQIALVLPSASTPVKHVIVGAYVTVNKNGSSV